MLINGIDISSIGIRLYDRVIKSNTVDTAEDWNDGDIQPTVIRQQDRFKQIQLAFLVLTSDEEDAFLRISRLTAMLKQASIKFDDINLVFKVNMQGANEPERLKNGNFIVRYVLTSDYAMGEREVYTTDANLANSFKLNILYYKDSITLLATDSMTLRASFFTGEGDTPTSTGINLDKYLPQYCNHGIITNIGNLEWTYENVQSIGTLIVNYAPIQYNIAVEYFINPGTGVYTETLQSSTSFTYFQLQNLSTIGQLIDTQTYRPEGYKSRIGYEGELTVEDLLNAGVVYVYYDKIENELTKTITVSYYKEIDGEEWELIRAQPIVVRESQFYDGMTLGDIININTAQPSTLYYNSGYILDHLSNELITYETVDIAYTVRYARSSNVIFVEYYIGTYPGWYRLTTATLASKYQDAYAESFDIDDLGIDINRYHTSEYETGRIYNRDGFTTYEEVITAGVVQVYYAPIDYPIVVRYYVDDSGTPIEETITVNALDFLNNPILSDIIDINTNKPEGYKFDVDLSYSGDITLSALTQASPISIYYEEIEADRTMNIVIRYKQELSSALSTINTSLITVNESDCVNGVRLRDLINLNQYRPDYYEDGLIDGASETALYQYDDLQSSYTVVYLASSYSTPVRYYVDEVSELNWIGSSSISYRIIDFAVDTTLYDFGLSLNAYKPSYCGDGVLDYTGQVNFAALREVSSLNVVYEKVSEPIDDGSGIDYPHRFLFLQHNDLGNYEYLHPNWTMNHAYINTGVSVDDMSKLTVIMECDRVDENVPLHEVNAGYGYLFGSSSGLGQFYMRFNNQTQYGNDLTGVNTYEARAGYYTNALVLTEENAVGFGAAAGIYSSERQNYSYATFTYTNALQSESAQMPYPLYLFANNNAGSYDGGLAGIGIYSCRIFYDGVLVRDMIPVQYYDKIGDQVAPSNCLYDKITQTFFEDATGMSSFNIRDDERYTDTNLEHQIGSCIVNYYKGEELFRTVMVWFRGNDFGNGYDAYTKFFVDENQPAYYHPGVIDDFSNLVFDFDNMNGSVYSVRYAEMENRITVNYYRQVGNTRTLIETETIGLTERDFYQAPTFGDIVRINKYKPEGFETDFEYTGAKVSLTRVMNLSPYDIVYKPIVDEIQQYTTTIRYIKKIYGIRTYETIGDITLTFDQSHFRDGEYIDFYIDLNAMKPEHWYGDGITYQWYEMDEKIDAPEKLKPMYIIAYPVETQYIPVNYYTDEVDEANLIASTTWAVNLDDFDPAYPFYIVDTLPNTYINKYRPLGCDGGVLQNSNTALNWEDLMALTEIAIVYDTVEEPNDPESAIYDAKVLYFGYGNNELYMDPTREIGPNYGARIPYIDLGYKPKEIGRLRVEMTAYAQSAGLGSSSINGYSNWSDDYLYFFGYWGCRDTTQGMSYNEQRTYLHNNSAAIANRYVDINTVSGKYRSAASKGCFGIKTRCPIADGWVFTAEGPQYVDGQVYYTGGSAAGVIAGQPVRIRDGMAAYYRKGCYADVDLDYNTFICYHEYGVSEDYRYDENGYPGSIMMTDGKMICRGRTSENYALANPYTIIMDAYNGYFSLSTYANSNIPYTYQVVDEDTDIFENREQPRGSLSLFRTTNPTTGRINIMPFDPVCYAGFGASGSMALDAVGAGLNPYTNTGEVGITQEYQVITSFTQEGTPIYETRSTTKNINYAHFAFTARPQLSGCFIWSIKIYDRDRLVRDLIPVAAGDRIYDYVMPENGLFDLITEIFFGNSNMGGTYQDAGYVIGNDGNPGYVSQTVVIDPSEVQPLYCVDDILYRGKITTNYYDYDNTFIDHQFVKVPYWFNGNNTALEDVLQWNDFKPDDFRLDGWLDLDVDYDVDDMSLAEIYELGTANVYYRLRTFTKTVVYYRDNVRVGSRDLFYSIQDIDQASTLEDLGIDVDLFYDEHFAHGRVVWDEDIIANDDMAAFIDAPSPIVVYDKLTQQEAPDLLYVEYYRGGAYEDNLITLSNNPNYLNCDLTARVLNPNGAIKYVNHYHSALYEDEDYDYFIPYQVHVKNRYAGLHSGPGRMYKVLAMIIERDTYTIIQERNGWGRLREYPNAWIMLNQTEPMTGPGQNPDYDVPDAAETSTIAFGEYVDITKLTIDRLWCYAPEVDSWIKAEDLSFNQAGKLYNGLKIEVIDLSEVDWTNVSSLADIGINVQKWKLRFHNDASYTYTGAYTREAFSNLHSIEIVYPETLYNYSCIYYRDNKAVANELGRSAFSCSISDWNPDWDTFIATSWQTAEVPIPGSASVRRNSQYVEGRVYIINTTNPIVENGSYNNTTEVWGYGQGTTGIPVYGEVIRVYLNGSSSSTQIVPVGVDEATGKTAYLILGSYVSVDTPFGGYETVEVNPTLYRDTEISLTWDYFGFERNAFKPTGYDDGIYLWNPRSWDIDNITFTFQELIRCGTQYVVYPPFNPNIYKLWVQRNNVASYTATYNGHSTTQYLVNPGLYNLDLSNSNNDLYYYQTNSGPYDMYFESEVRSADDGFTSAGHNMRVATNATSQHDPYIATLYTGSSYQYITDYAEAGDSVAISLSNHRFATPTIMIGIGNPYTEREKTYYYMKANGNLVKINDTTNLAAKECLVNKLSGSPTTTMASSSNSAYGDYGIIYKIASYNNFEMIHYWVPVPKGMWYRYDGETLRIADNGLFDLLTGTLATSFRRGQHTIQDTHTLTYIADGNDYIYQRSQNVDEAQPYNYFTGWEYSTTPLNTIVQTYGSEDLTTHEQPDEYATTVRTLAPNLFIPIEAQTNDSSNNVVGTWYKSCDQWFKSTSGAIGYSGGIVSGRLTKHYHSVGLVPPTTGSFSGFGVWLDPGTQSSEAYASYGSAAQVRQVYYDYTNSSGVITWVFDGAYWIPASHTDLNVVEVNQNYAIVQDIPYYTNAVINDDYKAGMYHYGDRITILYTAANNSNLGYTGQGWIEMENNVSIIE